MKKFIVLLLTFSCAHTLVAQEIKINLKQSSTNVIAYIPLKKALPPSATAYELTDKKEGTSYPAQLADSMTLVCILRGEQDKGLHTYTVTPGRVPPALSRTVPVTVPAPSPNALACVCGRIRTVRGSGTMSACSARRRSTHTACSPARNGAARRCGTCSAGSRPRAPAPTPCRG